MERELGRVMEKLHSAIGDAEKLLNAISAMQAEGSLTRISARAAQSVREARAQLHQDHKQSGGDASQSLMAGLLALARTRMELFSVEFHSNMAQETSALTGKLAALILGITGGGFAAVAVAIAIGEQHRALGAAIFAGIFVSLSAVAIWKTWRSARSRDHMLELSLAELERDLEDLKVKDLEEQKVT